jgi:hypothetical protein
VSTAAAKHARDNWKLKTTTQTTIDTLFQLHLEWHLAHRLVARLIIIGLLHHHMRHLPGTLLHMEVIITQAHMRRLAVHIHRNRGTPTQRHKPHTTNSPDTWIPAKRKLIASPKTKE